MFSLESIKDAIYYMLWSFFDVYYKNSMVIFVVAILSGLYLLVFEKEIRKKYIIPLIIIMLVIVNPVVFNVVLKDSVYRRMIWLDSDLLLIALATICLFKRSKSVWLKSLLIFGLCFCFIVVDRTNAFEGNREDFVPMTNIEKLPTGVKEVADAILKYEDEPRCITDMYISMHIRQYDGNIHLLYGRDVYNGCLRHPDETEKEIWSAFASRDFDTVLDFASKNEYHFIVTGSYDEYCQEYTGADPLAQDLLDKYGFECIFDDGHYQVYRKI